MNIGFVSTYFPPFAVGGGEWSAFYLGQALAEAGHRVFVITPNYGAPSRETMAGMHVRRFPFPQRIQPGRMARAIFVQNPLYHLYLATVLIRTIRRESLQVLHAQDVHAFLPTLLAARRTGLRSMATVRDPQSICSGGMECFLAEDSRARCSFRRYGKCLAEFWGLRPAASKSKWRALKYFLHGSFNWLDLQVRRLGLRRFDAIIAVSSYIQGLCERNGYGSVAHKIHVVPNLIQVKSSNSIPPKDVRARYNLPPDAPLILYAGRITRGKGIDVLLAAAEQVVKSVPQAVFLVAGAGPSPLPIPAGLSRGEVRHLGFLPNAETISLIEASNVVVLPARWGEPLSRLLLEALSRGKPIVATRVGGNPEIVEDGVNGYLVDKNAPPRLAEALVKLLLDSPLAKRMGEQGTRIMKRRYAREAVLPEMLSLYQGMGREN